MKNNGIKVQLKDSAHCVILLRTVGSAFMMSLAITECSPSEAAASSPQRPWMYTPRVAALSGVSEPFFLCAKMPPRIPERTSPEPPVAIPLFPLLFI